jgi:hypothetical protein
MNGADMFVVHGGEYADTSFTKLVSEEEVYGPFPTYKQALDQWSSATRWKVDICTHRLFIDKS